MEGATWPKKDIDMLKYIAPAYCDARFILYLSMTAFTTRSAMSTSIKVPGRRPPNRLPGCLNFLFFIQFYDVKILEVTCAEGFSVHATISRNFFWLPALFLSTIFVWCLIAGQAQPTTQM
jgi:hypothetical protein